MRPIPVIMTKAVNVVRLHPLFARSKVTFYFRAYRDFCEPKNFWQAGISVRRKQWTSFRLFKGKGMVGKCIVSGSCRNVERMNEEFDEILRSHAIWISRMMACKIDTRRTRQRAVSGQTFTDQVIVTLLWYLRAFNHL